MHRTTPLRDHPQLILIEHQGWREFRVEARRPVVSRALSPTVWLDALLVLVLAFYWNEIAQTPTRIVASTLAVTFYLHSRATQLLWESVVILPSLGIQLETHRGLAGRSLFVARKFIPWSSLEDFLINEGIRGWNIRYYCVAISRTPQGTVQLEVAFENILPKFPVLLELYHSVQEALLSEKEDRSRPT